MIKDIHKIAEHYGFASQSIMLIEEMAELTQAITKYKRYMGSLQPLSKLTRIAELEANIAEEIADVEIMLAQMKYLLYISDEKLNEIKAAKIKRTLDIIEQEGYK